MKDGREDNEQTFCHTVCHDCCLVKACVQYIVTF